MSNNFFQTFRVKVILKKEVFYNVIAKDPEQAKNYCEKEYGDILSDYEIEEMQSVEVIDVLDDDGLMMDDVAHG